MPIRRKSLKLELVVANSVLEKGFVHDMTLSPMKLQKLVYFVYKHCLQNTNRSLFEEYFEAWKYGPVLPSIYQEFKRFGANSILSYAYSESDPKQRHLYVVSTDYTPFYQALDFVWGRYHDRSGIELSELTHAEGTAWHKAREQNCLYLADDDIAVERWLR